jgi:hypothetical protein
MINRRKESHPGLQAFSGIGEKGNMQKTSTDGVFRCVQRNSYVRLLKGLDIGHVYISSWVRSR